MTLTFRKPDKWTGGTNPLAVDGAFSINPDDLKAYRNDTIHLVEQRKAWKLHAIRASSRYHLSRIFNRMTLPNSTMSPLLAFSLFGLITHTFA